MPTSAGSSGDSDNHGNYNIDNHDDIRSNTLDRDHSACNIEHRRNKVQVLRRPLRQHMHWLQQ